VYFIGVTITLYIQDFFYIGSDLILYNV